MHKEPSPVFQGANTYMKNILKDDALKHLGYGLHAIQDIEAHGQIGRGDAIPQHIKPSNGNNINKI